MTTVIVSTRRVARFLEGGGHFWVYMQYVLGLRHLGCEVYWLEHVQPRGDPARDAATLATFTARMARYGMADKLILYSRQEQEQEQANRAGADADTEADADTDAGAYRYIGLTPRQAEALLERADLLLNFDYSIAPALLAHCRRTALVDIDPGLLQFWLATRQLVAPPHDLYLTTGETVGTPGARFPDGGHRWLHIRPPVSLEAWPYTYTPRAAAFTTVSSWWGQREYVTYGAEYYDNNKRASFLEFVELPRHTPQPLELALFFGEGDEQDQRALAEHGWRVRHSREVAGTPERYQGYIQGSRGEFSCAKPSCMKFQAAWVSDRTLCYLASGKPVVVQHTGPSAFLPNGAGMFRFTTLEEAVEALASINRAYKRHSQAARALAEAYFDARQVLSAILNLAL